MTLILTCVTPYYAIQVSDRRLTFLDGRIREHPENKTLFYNGFATFAYSGLATIGRVPTDEWLMDRLGDSGSFGAALGALTDAATRALRNLNVAGATPQQRRVWRRLAVVGAGFVGLRHPEVQGRRAVPDHIHPFLSVVSNFFSLSGKWQHESDVRFTCSFQYLPDNEEMLLFAAGKPLSQLQEKELKRSLRRCLSRSKSPWPAVRLLARQVRAVWCADKKGVVGPNIMCMVLPRPTNPNQVSVRGSPIPLRGQELTEIEVFRGPLSADEFDIEKQFIYWPYDSSAFPYYQPNVVASDGRKVKGGRIAPVEVAGAEVLETAVLSAMRLPHRPRLP